MNQNKCESLAASFETDLLTDWVPDTIGAVDMTDLLRRGTLPDWDRVQAGSLLVPMADKTESIPVVDVTVRARLHAQVDTALYDNELDTNVFSYRTASNYRTAYRQRTQLLRTLAHEHSICKVLIADIQRFSASFPLATLALQPWMSEALLESLKAIHLATGQCLLPGHMWSNRVGSAALATVDKIVRAMVGDRWTRWADDVHVFVRDEQEASDVLLALREAVAKLGLALSKRKTRVVDAAFPLRGPARDVSGDPRSVWETACSTEDLRGMRYALPRLAKQHDAIALEQLEYVTSKHLYLLPRAFDYLDRLMPLRRAELVAQKIIERETSVFASARSFAFVLRHPSSSSCLPDHLLDVAQNSDILAVRCLLWQVRSLRGESVGEPPSPRLREHVKNTDARQAVPRLETLL